MDTELAWFCQKNEWALLQGNCYILDWLSKIVVRKNVFSKNYQIKIINSVDSRHSKLILKVQFGIFWEPGAMSIHKILQH